MVYHIKSFRLRQVDQDPPMLGSLYAVSHEVEIIVHGSAGYNASLRIIHHSVNKFIICI